MVIQPHESRRIVGIACWWMGNQFGSQLPAEEVGVGFAGADGFESVGAHEDFWGAGARVVLADHDEAVSAGGEDGQQVSGVPLAACLLRRGGPDVPSATLADEPPVAPGKSPRCTGGAFFMVAGAEGLRICSGGGHGVD